MSIGQLVKKGYRVYMESMSVWFWINILETRCCKHAYDKKYNLHWEPNLTGGKNNPSC